MNRNTILAVVLSMLVIIGWSFVGPKLFPQFFTRPETTQPGFVSSQDDAGAPEYARTYPDVDQRDEITRDEAWAETPQETVIHIETNKLHVTFSSLGAGIKALKFKPIDLHDHDEIPFIENQMPPYVLSLQSLLNRSDLAKRPFRVIDETPFSVKFETELSREQVTVSQEYQFMDDSYEFDLTTIITNRGNNSVFFEDGFEILVGRSIVGDKKDGQFKYAFYMEDNAKNPVFEKYFGKNKYDPVKVPLNWTGLQNKYFVHIFDPQSGYTDIVLRRLKNEEEFWITAKTDDFMLSPEEQIVHQARFYAGPKNFEILKSYNQGFEKISNFGMFGKIVMVMLATLRFFYKIFGSYGWAIIALTLLVKVLLHPLTHKSFQSMKIQKELAPKITALREKHKSDPQKVQKEMMALYRKEGVNPLGGCLPMLLQLPVFFALFSTLRSSFELRHAPFLWIVDLADKDPYYILPVVTLGVTFLQQKLTPSGGDPKQQKMMMMMMIPFLGFFMFSFPAGLLIYWLISSLVSMGQQFYYFRKK
ncbi:membrane protein insertase YidC [PVC group bacterium]|nr:membrane protein insertase YidC [PVC group bacterium]